MYFSQIEYILRVGNLGLHLNFYNNGYKVTNDIQ